MLIQAINQSNQTNDGSGVNVGYGPEYISDVTLDHVMFAHFGGGFVVVPLDAALGIHRISFSNLLCDDCNVQRWGHGFLKIIAGLQTGGTAGTKVLGWTSAATPLADNVSFNHITEVGNFTNPFAINSNNAQFKLINFTFQNSFFAAVGSSTFVNANGEANDCDTAAGTGSTNTELKALVPCFAPYTFDHLNLTDSTAPPSTFLSSPIWQLTHSAVGFVNYNSGKGGDYRLCTGVNLPAAPCAGVSSFAAGQANQASDGRDLGADIVGINAVQSTVRGGVRTP
jgi:hypothetical protein